MLTEDDNNFLTGAFERLEGWCHVEAAAITLHLQQFQLAEGWSGPNYEIGVFKGKYLSVLHRAATLAGQRTTGIDIFTVEPRHLVAAALERELGRQDNLKLVERDSGTYTPAEIIAEIGGLASWISIDGDHSADGVHRDLRNAEATLAPWGVIAIDDFVNVYALGVLEGATRFLSGGDTRLRPFCLCANKLLVTFDSRVETYHSQVPVFCRENAQHSMTREFVHRRTNLSEGWVTQQLFGRAIWLIA